MKIETLLKQPAQVARIWYGPFILAILDSCWSITGKLLSCVGTEKLMSLHVSLLADVYLIKRSSDGTKLLAATREQVKQKDQRGGDSLTQECSNKAYK